MNLCLHTVCPQIILQVITTLTKHGENMPYAVAFRLGNHDARIAYLIQVAGCYLLAAKVGFVEMAQFDIEDGCLHFVDA